MNKKTAENIIKEYHPHKGFFDLSKKPNDLDDVEYAKILELQNYLASENEKMNTKAIREANKSHWDSLKRLSAKLQGIIFSHWDLSSIN